MAGTRRNYALITFAVYSRNIRVRCRFRFLRASQTLMRFSDVLVVLKFGVLSS